MSRFHENVHSSKSTGLPFWRSWAHVPLKIRLCSLSSPTFLHGSAFSRDNQRGASPLKMLMLRWQCCHDEKKKLLRWFEAYWRQLTAFLFISSVAPLRGTRLRMQCWEKEWRRKPAPCKIETFAPLFTNNVLCHCATTVTLGSTN